jgi:surfeit locus 1 family protein
VVLLAAAVAMGVTARLGWWQLDRAAIKTQIAERLQERSQLPPLRAVDLRGPSPDELHQRQVVLRGQWVPQATVYLDNRPMQGLAGFVVVTPLRLTGQTDAVLVQRGWVPRDFQDRTRLPALHTPDGEVEVLGAVAPPPSQLYAFGQADSGVIRQNIELPAYGQETGLSLLPLSVVQVGPEDSQFRRAWPQPGLDVAKHHGYAFQWFALCALIGLLYVWFQLIAPLRARRR